MSVFSAQTNPREHCNEISAERGKIIVERDGKVLGVEKEKYETERERDEKDREKKRSEEEKNKNKERGVIEKYLSYPHAPSKKKKRRKYIFFINCSLKIILQEL